MCGFVGIRRFDGTPVEEGELVSMQACLAHRGPDDHGVAVEGDLGLGHTRLAVLDPTIRAAQPMPSRCGRYLIAYNGEIYNYRELRRRLENAGHPVLSSGDTEVLLESIATRGLDAVLPELEGFFAFALWDRRDRVLRLVRDRHGIKPLYYLRTTREVRFASEPKALLSPRTQVDSVTLEAMLLGRPCTWGPHTLHRDIHRVRAGEVIRFGAGTGGGVTSRQFRTPLDFVDAGLHEELAMCTDAALVDRLDKALNEAVALRLRSDAPVACLVSGGVDSSLVAAIAARQSQSVALYHADVVHNSERQFATRLAEHLGLPLHAEQTDDRDILENLALATWHNDAPISYHVNSVPFSLVCRAASGDGVKVVLTGEGADEYFLGYPQIARQPWIDRYRSGVEGLQQILHRWMPRAAQVLWPRGASGRLELLGRLTRRDDDEPDLSAALHHITDDADRRHVVTSLDLVRRHLTTLLHRNDRMAMAWGIESRFPFLGHRVAALAVNLPRRARLRMTRAVHHPGHPFVVDKWVVRKVAERYLPSELCRRPKKAFPVSVFQRLRIDSGFFRDGFLADRYGLTGPTLEELLCGSPRAWGSQLLAVEIWARLFVRGQRVDEVRTDVLRAVEVADAPQSRRLAVSRAA
ncbi:MAG: asparagine synthase (glutamine-hydrolyzing) [Planctomycetota bacterium]|jgi:asparagine synthase (glutamine-hydrolysing)